MEKRCRDCKTEKAFSEFKDRSKTLSICRDCFYEEFGGRDWPTIRGRALSSSGKICYACGKKFHSHSLSVHHIIPRRKGINNDKNNLVVLCYQCHDRIERNTTFYNCKKNIQLVFQLSKLTRRKSTWKFGVRWQQWVYGGYRRPNLPTSNAFSDLDRR